MCLASGPYPPGELLRWSVHQWGGLVINGDNVAINATVVVVRNDRFGHIVTSFIMADLYYESSSF